MYIVCALFFTLLSVFNQMKEMSLFGCWPSVAFSPTAVPLLTLQLLKVKRRCLDLNCLLMTAKSKNNR